MSCISWKKTCHHKPAGVVEEALKQAVGEGKSGGGGTAPKAKAAPKPKANAPAIPPLAEIRAMRQVGEGSFGAVVISPDGKTAYKYMKDDVGAAPGVKPYKIDSREIKVMQAASDTGVGPKLLGVNKDRTAIAMEFLSGYRPLSDIEPNWALPKRDQQEIARNVIRQAQKLHEAGITHHDFHTGNVLYSPETLSVRVVDYGLARLDTKFQGNAAKDFDTILFFAKMANVPIFDDDDFQDAALAAIDAIPSGGNIYEALLKAIDDA
jgi:predicted Ser/Thr protein kinase